MTFQEVLPYFEKGLAIQRESWHESSVFSKSMTDLRLSVDDLKAKDWIIRGVTFDVAINALLQGKHIMKMKDKNSPEKYICYRQDKLYMGLGCCGVHEYAFTKKDVMARDWMVGER